MDYVYPHEQAQVPTPPENPFLSVHLPLTFLSVGLALFFVGENRALKQKTSEVEYEAKGREWALSNLEWRKASGEKQLKDLGEFKDKLEKANTDRKALVDQSSATQAQFTSMMKELDELARGGDKDAALIISSYGIKVNDTAPAAPAPSAAPAPAAAPTPAAPAPAPAPAVKPK